MTLGVRLDPNGTSWASISDQNAKENVEPVNVQWVLKQIKQLPVSWWNYKEDPQKRRYIGPMAQDFHDRFGLGDRETISTLDVDGVLLAAVQALALENEELRRRLEALEKREGPQAARTSRGMESQANLRDGSLR